MPTLYLGDRYVLACSCTLLTSRTLIQRFLGYLAVAEVAHDFVFEHGILLFLEKSQEFVLQHP